MKNNYNKPSPKVNKLWKIACEEHMRLQDDINIIKVGYGIKFVKNKPTYQICLRYFVAVKFDNEKDIELAHSKPIPKEVGGFLTDIVKYTIPKPLSCPEDDGTPTGDRGTREEDPLVGGTSTTVLSNSFPYFRRSYGTLGGICFDDSTGEAMALSNAHVWGNGIGDDVIQPWLPIDEFGEALVKVLSCGPAAFLMDLTMPSALTAALTAAAAAAWIAAIASDVEDPNRWGQRTTPPPRGSLTTQERVTIKTTIPETPFAGYPYASDVSWNYSRKTNNGNLNANKTEKHQNEHVLLEKRVWTEKSSYYPGDEVKICAEIASTKTSKAEDYFVVAQCYPTSNPDRVIPRILIPGDCKVPGDKIENCFHGFDLVGKPNSDLADFPIKIDVFEFLGKYAWFRGPFPNIIGDNSTVLEIGRDIELKFPESYEVIVDLFITVYPTSILARNTNGVVVDTVTSSDKKNEIQRLKLTGPNISSIIFRVATGGVHVVGVCISRKEEQKHHEKENRFTYTGTLGLDVGENKDKWNIVLFAQTVDNSPPGTKPEIAAQNIGGITASANIASVGTCVGVMILDHVFDVI